MFRPTAALLHRPYARAWAQADHHLDCQHTWLMTSHQPMTPSDWQDQLGGVAELMGEDVSWREDDDEEEDWEDEDWEDEDMEVDEDEDDEEDNEDDEGEAEEGGEASEALSVVIAPNGAPQIVMGAAEKGGGSDADTDETIGDEGGELDKASVPAGDPDGGKALTHAELDNILGQMGYEPNSAGFTRIL